MTTKPTFYDFDAMVFRPEIAHAALHDVSHLEAAFSWEKTPQGGAYWKHKAEHGLDLVARSTLAYMIAESVHMSIRSGGRRAAA